MKFFINKIFLIIILFTVKNQLFSAGAHLSIDKDSKIKNVLHVTLYEKIFPSEGMVMMGPAFDLDGTKTKDFDGVMRGFNRIDWTEQLIEPDDRGNNFIDYRLILYPGIHGFEGWRDWEFLGGGKIDISGWGLNPAYSSLQGEVRYR